MDGAGRGGKVKGRQGEGAGEGKGTEGEGDGRRFTQSSGWVNPYPANATSVFFLSSQLTIRQLIK